MVANVCFSATLELDQAGLALSWVIYGIVYVLVPVMGAAWFIRGAVF